MNRNLVETHMEGSVLSFLRAELKVSDTGSAHWASSLNIGPYKNMNKRLFSQKLQA
jgi:hypothetical protein